MIKEKAKNKGKDEDPGKSKLSKTFESNNLEVRNLWNPINWNFKEFFCGWGSAFINICVTYPINKITFRQMLHDLSPSSAFKEISSEGLHVLYRGILPPLLQKTTSLSLMFGVYEGTRVPLTEIMPPVPAKILAALISGSTEATLAPFERIQTLLQDKKYQQQFANTKHAFLTIPRKYGYREFYRGLVPILFRNGPSNVCYFLMRDAAKVGLEARPSLLGKMVVDFVLGGFIGALISTVFYPLNVTKVHLQSKLGGEFQSVHSAVIQIYNDRANTNHTQINNNEHVKFCLNFKNVSECLVPKSARHSDMPNVPKGLSFIYCINNQGVACIGVHQYTKWLKLENGGQLLCGNTQSFVI